MSQTISKNILLIMLSELREWIRFLVNWKEHRILREVSESYVPTTRTINGQSLDKDITLSIPESGDSDGGLINIRIEFVNDNPTSIKRICLVVKAGVDLSPESSDYWLRFARYKRVKDRGKDERIGIRRLTGKRYGWITPCDMRGVVRKGERPDLVLLIVKDSPLKIYKGNAYYEITVAGWDSLGDYLARSNEDSGYVGTKKNEETEKFEKVIIYIKDIIKYPTVAVCLMQGEEQVSNWAAWNGKEYKRKHCGGI